MSWRTASPTTDGPQCLRLWLPPRSGAAWRDLVLPKEHGSWSLAFEPLALGLLAAPSVAGSWFALAVAAGFFCRRPLRIAWRDASQPRREAAWSALGWCAVCAVAAVILASAVAGIAWLGWLLPALVCGVIFLVYDLRNDGRQELAEIAGTAAFASLPAVLAVLAGWNTGNALALAAAMFVRAVPTVVFVRAAVRGRKTGRSDFAPATRLAILAFLGTGLLVGEGLAPRMLIAWSAFFLVRLAIVRVRPGIRAKHLGIFEAVTGVAFVVTTAVSWK